ncbi:5-methylcytosine-specific restriction endonuclease system specificity protein McrC [Desulfosarcina sp. OttesenSCG-928-G10]|nr:5-methylcytosine-specific restriction endonuclease system specificity protein McrC [Desulfosarcina sp. OttesenSCG-928-G10]MDL2320818.1 5-methylcytosine-specific restriction endonuclease system specificity protein McrC [Desulfosarcina sp. OttesenSCG-928-B08]
MADHHRIKNIYYMLSYAFRSLRETGFNTVAAEDFDNIHDLFAAIIACGVGSQVKRGLHRDYVLKEETLAGLRGQIRAAESIKQQTFPQGKLACAYDAFTEDSPHNQVLKSTLFMLLRHGNVKAENKKALRKLLLYFSQVTDVAPETIRWDALKYHRNNASYRMLTGLCRLAIKGLLLTTEAGEHKLSSWLQDEAMHKLYENFVLSYFQHHHPAFSPKAAYINWDLWGEADTACLPTMKTDITLSNGDRRLIIDTKYYSRTMTSHYDSARFISGHLYQIYAYVKNCDIGATGNVAGVLLYAKTDEAITPDAEFNISGNQIALKTLDLNRNWRAIIAQLDDLCAWLNPDAFVDMEQTQTRPQGLEKKFEKRLSGLEG